MAGESNNSADLLSDHPVNRDDIFRRARAPYGRGRARYALLRHMAVAARGMRFCAVWPGPGCCFWGA